MRALTIAFSIANAGPEAACARARVSFPFVSYDYLLFRAPADGPMSSWSPTAKPEPLGTAREIQALVAQLFPGVKWSPFKTSKTSHFGRWESGEQYAEFQLTPYLDGQFRSLSMSRARREDVERLCQRLDLVVVDPAGALYSTAAGAWRWGP